MRVWIDQDECTGVGVCVDACPQAFALGASGVAHVMLGDRSYGNNEVAVLDDSLLEHVLDAAEDCPQECIYVELG